MSTASIFAIILSIFGNIISIGTALSPIKTFLEIDKNRDVGPMNIYPIIALCGNSLCWIIYGTVIKDMSILPVNVIGLLVTGYFITIFMSACSELNKRRLVSGVIFGYLAALTVYHLIVLFYVENYDTQKKIFGITCNVVVLIFYGSPVLVLYGVIKSRDRSVINLPLALVSCLAGLIWTFYGIVKQNTYVAVPNAAGASLSAISLVVYFGVGYANAIQNRKPSTPDGASQDVGLIESRENENMNNQLNDDIELEEEDKI